MKKIIFSVLCTAFLAAPVLSSFPHTTFAETLAQQNDNQPQNSNHQIEEDIVVEGKMIAIKISSVNSQKEVLQDRTVVTLQFDTQYQFKEAATELDKEIFQNETSTMEIELTNDGTYYMDGEALTQADLDMDLSSYASGSSLNGGPAMQIAAGDYGGVASFSHYRSSDFNFYALNTYSAISKTLKPSGSHISKSGAIGNPKVARAMTLMNSFQTNFNNMHTSIQGVLTGAASFGLTLGTVIGAVISGTVVSGTAIAALNYWKACNSDLQRTYDLLATM